MGIVSMFLTSGNKVDDILLMHAQSYQDSATPWTAARQASLWIEIWGQKCWSGLPFSFLEYLLNPGIKLTSLASPALASRFFATYHHLGSPWSEADTSSEVKVTQLCPTLCNPMDSIVHGILQARILEWVAFPSSRGSFQPRDQTQVSCITDGFFTSWTTGKRKNAGVGSLSLLQQIL